MLFSRHTKRREFIAGVGSTAAWPLAARAQQAAMPEIGYLSGRSARAEASMLAAFDGVETTSGGLAASQPAGRATPPQRSSRVRILRRRETLVVLRSHWVLSLASTVPTRM
jgi:hypothetical protein